MNLITGATGHIGNVLARELARRSQPLRGFTLPGEDRSALQGLPIEIVEGDVLDLPSLLKACQGVDTVYHLAGLINILPGANDLVRRVNLQGTLNVIEAARRAGVRRLVYTSSIHAIRRVPAGIAVDERLPFDPSSPTNDYDRSKAEASLAVQEAVRQGLDAVIACPTGVIGPYDYRLSDLGRLMRDWMQKRVHFLVEGGFDFVDVRDVAHGLALAGERGRSGQTYLLSGKRTRLVTLREIVQEVLGFKMAAILIPMGLARLAARLSPAFNRLQNRPPRFTLYSLEAVATGPVVSAVKAGRELGYRARPTYETVRDTVRWFQGKLA